MPRSNKRKKVGKMTEEEIKQYASKGSATEFASLDKVLGEYVAAVDELEDVRRKRTELAASAPGIDG